MFEMFSFYNKQRNVLLDVMLGVFACLNVILNRPPLQQNTFLYLTALLTSLVLICQRSTFHRFIF